MAKAVLAGLMTFLLVLTSLLAVSPAHDQSHQLHHDASKQNCALCLLSHGLVEAVDPAPVLTPRDLVATEAVVLPLSVVIPAPDYQLLPGRAPPFFS